MNEENPYDSMFESLVSRYQINRDNHIIKHNDNHTLIIPKSVEQVLKKIIPGLEEVNIHSYEKNKFFHPEDFSTHYRYSVYLEMFFSWDVKNVPNNDKLQEIVNSRFKAIYPNVDNLKFVIRDVTIKMRDYDKEFFELFTRG